MDIVAYIEVTVCDVSPIENLIDEIWVSLKKQSKILCLKKQKRMEADFSVLVHAWRTARAEFDTQVHMLRTAIEAYRHKTIVITHIPRHHAKKLQAQSDWTKDYFVSKESRQVTTELNTNKQQIGGQTAVPLITLIFSMYPTTTEQWFALDNDTGFAHVVDVCIPLNAWKPTSCPLALLQEYRLTYDEVSTITVVATSEMTPGLRETFNERDVPNSVVFISEQGVIEKRLRFWKEIVSAGSGAAGGALLLALSIEG